MPSPKGAARDPGLVFEGPASANRRIGVVVVWVGGKRFYSSFSRDTKGAGRTELEQGTCTVTKREFV